MKPNVRRILWVDNDDGNSDIMDRLYKEPSWSGLSREEILKADLIITDRGRIFKNRWGPNDVVVDSYDLVKPKSQQKRGKYQIRKYRSIFDE